MIQEQLIKNYVVALFNNAKERDIADVVFEQIKIINTIIEDNVDIKRSLLSPIISKKYKMQLVSTLSTTLKVDRIVYNFLSLLVKNSRTSILSLVIGVYHELWCKEKGVQIIYITSAKILEKQEQDWIRNFIQEKLRKEFQMMYSVDPAIIGGITIKYESILIDYSIKGSLARISKAMISSLQGR